MKKNYECKDFLKNIDADYIERAVDLFIDNSIGFETRSNTWDNCHNCFKDLHITKGDYSNLSGFDKERARLYLMNYLASWGMYRGSTFVLQYDDKIYDDIIEIIFNSKYDDLWDLSYNFLKNNFKYVVHKVIELIGELDAILAPYRNFTYFEKTDWIDKLQGGNNNGQKNNSNEQKGQQSVYQVEVSRTLISKILLGTICCMPALDTNFNSVTEYKNPPLNKYYLEFLFDMILKKGTGGIYDNSNDNSKNKANMSIFEKLENKYKKDQKYPLMKIVDMAFFTIGDEKVFKGLFENYVLNGMLSANDEKWKAWVKLLKHFYRKIVPNGNVSLRVAFLYEWSGNLKIEIKEKPDSKKCKQIEIDSKTFPSKNGNNGVKIVDLDSLIKKHIDDNIAQ